MNRELVERATHPEALEALTCELEAVEKKWRDARQRIEGAGMSEVQQAQHAAMRWGSPMVCSIFPEDESIATRLGSQDLAVVLPDGVRGPFGEPVKMLAIPSFWLGSIDPTGDLAPQAVAENVGRLTFRIQIEIFTYDRLGLRRGAGDGGGGALL